MLVLGCVNHVESWFTYRWVVLPPPIGSVSATRLAGIIFFYLSALSSGSLGHSFNHIPSLCPRKYGRLRHWFLQPSRDPLVVTGFFFRHKAWFLVKGCVLGVPCALRNSASDWPERRFNPTWWDKSLPAGPEKDFRKRDPDKQKWCIWSNYRDLTQPHPKRWLRKGNPLISRKIQLLKYYNLARWFAARKDISLSFFDLSWFEF